MQDNFNRKRFEFSINVLQTGVSQIFYENNFILDFNFYYGLNIYKYIMGHLEENL